jgi:hypothetical protein
LALVQRSQPLQRTVTELLILSRKTSSSPERTLLAYMLFTFLLRYCRCIETIDLLKYKFACLREVRPCHTIKKSASVLELKSVGLLSYEPIGATSVVKHLTSP